MPQKEIDLAMWYFAGGKKLINYEGVFAYRDKLSLSLLCRQFAVSKSAAVIRLRHLGYIEDRPYCWVDGASTESNCLAINQQLTALRSLAGQLGFSISAEMLQYESGLDANRQSIRTLIRDARHGVYDRVLVMNGDRLARDAEGLAAIGEKLTAAGVRVYCPDGEIDLAPAYSHGYFRVATMEQTM